MNEEQKQFVAAEMTRFLIPGSKQIPRNQARHPLKVTRYDLAYLETL